MLGKLMAAIKGVLAQVGIIKQINNVAQFASVQASEFEYERILIWRALYSGYLDRWLGMPYHDATYTTIDGQKRKRRIASLNMAKVACEKMASLVYNEKCIINISDDQLSENIHNVLDDNNFNKRFQNFLEYGFAMGGFCIKPYVANGEIKISFVTAQNFFPLQTTNDQIEAGVFVSQTAKGDKFFSLLEWHTWEGTDYVITNELYQSTTVGDLGIKVSLDILYPNMEKEIRIQNLSRPLFIYIKPNIANNFETNSPLGISIFGNAIDTLKSIDEEFDSFRREFSLSKRRIVVSSNAVRSIVDPNTGEMKRYFDTEDEVYQAMDLGDGMDGELIKDIAFPLRVQEHIDGINTHLNYFAAQIGMTPGTFTFNNAGVKTATEVISENSETFRTKQAHETLVEHGLKELVDSIVELAQLYNLFPAPKGDYDVTVEFDDSITEDRTQNANFCVTMVAAELMPKVEALKRIFGLTDEQALDWLNKIKAEQAQPAPLDPNQQDTGQDGQPTAQKPDSMLTQFLTTAEMQVKNADR